MTLFVLDASCVAAWLLPTQRTAASEQLSNEWVLHRGVAPFLLGFEVRSALRKNERISRLSAEQTEARLANYSLYGVTLMEPPTDSELDQTLRLARSLDVTLFDAAYIELAQMMRAPLASRDEVQLAAARRLGVDVLDLRT